MKSSRISSWGQIAQPALSERRHPDGLVGVAERTSHAPGRLTARQEKLIRRCHGKNVTVTRLSARTGLPVRHVRRYAKDEGIKLA